MQIEAYKIPVVVIGSESVGKTSIIMRYCMNVFKPQYLPTLCSDKYIKPYGLKEGKNIELQIWDIGGQEQYSIEKKFYLKAAAVVIIVFSIDDPVSFFNLDDLVGDVREHAAPGTPVILVANKVDLRDGTGESGVKNFVTPGQFESEATTLGCFAWVETSAKENVNVVGLFDIVANSCNVDQQCREPSLLDLA